MDMPKKVNYRLPAQMAELVDALVSGTSLCKEMGVRVPLWALHPALEGGVFAFIMARTGSGRPRYQPEGGFAIFLLKAHLPVLHIRMAILP